VTGALLDTHALLWWLGDDAQLSAVARGHIADPRRTVNVSAATLWEVAMERSLGKLDAPDDLLQVVVDGGFTVLPVNAVHPGRWATCRDTTGIRSTACSSCRA
jgi:PIN domain nuclease of toxin-antitoxin system